MMRAGWIGAGPGLWLGHRDSRAAAPGTASVSGEIAPLPGWLRAVFGPAALAADYARLDAALDRTEAAIAADPPGPLAAAALRTLVIHRWRRLLLRHPDLPEAFFPEEWASERCRARVLRLHAALSPAAEAWLSTALDAPVQLPAK
jgi:phenylacetic acid degradation operon negative regulatory protein